MRNIKGVGKGFVLGVGFELRVTPRVVARGGFISMSILRPAPHHSTVIGNKRVRHRCLGSQCVTKNLKPETSNIPGKILHQCHTIPIFYTRKENISYKDARSKLIISTCISFIPLQRPFTHLILRIEIMLIALHYCSAVQRLSHHQYLDTVVSFDPT